MQHFTFAACQPPVVDIVFGEQEEVAVSERMRELFAADQAARQKELIDWSRLSVEDEQRRVETLAYLAKGQLCLGQSLFYAAFIFQHGNCADHFQLAHRLAARALEVGYDQARWIYAATLDRYLLSTGQDQKYGTQYIVTEDGNWKLQPFDQATTDEERQQFNVPILAEQLRIAETRGG